VGRRVTDPAEELAQQVTERVVDLVVSALDINEILAHVDLNALLSRIDLDALLGRMDIDALLSKVDVNALMSRVDVNALLDHVDVNELIGRVDIEALVQNTDLGAVIASSTGGVASEGLEVVRSRTVGLDQLVDRWVKRLLRRKETGPGVPPALLPPPVTSVEVAP